MKICSKCGFEGENDLFAKKNNICKECIKKMNKQYKLANKEKLKIKQNQYNVDNVEKIRSGRCKYHLDNKQKRNIISRQYKIDHVDAMKEYSKQYYNNYKEDIKKKDISSPERRLCINAKYRAKKKNIPFNITKEDIKNLIPEDMICPLLGIEMKVNNKLRENSITLDRIVPEFGYVKNNIQVISYRANSSKNSSLLYEYQMLVLNFRNILKNGIKLNRNCDIQINLYEKLSSSKHRSKINNIPFNITLKDIEKVYPENGLCPLLGIQLSKDNMQTTPSLDKIIPYLGYVKGNIQIISNKANVMKRNLAIEEMETILHNWEKQINDNTTIYG